MAEETWGRASPSDTGRGEHTHGCHGRAQGETQTGEIGFSPSLWSRGGADGGLLYLRAVTDPLVAAGLPFGSWRVLGGLLWPIAGPSPSGRPVWGWVPFRGAWKV